MSTAVHTDLPEVVLQAKGRPVVLELRELWSFRALLWRLAKRDLTLRYRQTFLGVSWVVLQPLLASALLSFAFGTVAGLPSDGVPYFLLSLTGFLAFNAYQNVTSRCTTVMLSNSGLVTKVYFPRLILPLSTIGTTLVDLAVGCVAALAILLSQGIGLSWRVVALPAALAMSLLFALGVGLALSALAVPYRDIAYIGPFLTQLVLYASPVGYDLSNVKGLGHTILTFNPMTGIVGFIRWSLLPGRAFPTAPFAVAGVMTILVLAIGFAVFSSMEREMADVI